MEVPAQSDLATRIANRPLPRWRDAAAARTRWAFGLRGRSMATRQSAYGLHGYRTYRAFRLRSDYSEIETDLRSVFDHYAGEPWFDTDSARQVIDILDSVRPALERPDPNLDIVNDDLGRARRLMVWVKPPAWIDLVAQEIEAQLRGSQAPEAQGFTLAAPDLAGRRFRIDEAIGILDHVATLQAIDNGLQVRRLELIRNVGLLAVSLLIAFAPILVSGASLSFWKLDGLVGASQVDAWMTTLGIALVGAIGALLSGLLQVRSSPVTFTDYEMRGIEVALRVLVGSAVAVTLYYLLSWQVVPVITVTSAGTFLLVAFASGFSERYFLKLLGLDAAAHEGGRDPGHEAAHEAGHAGSHEAAQDGSQPAAPDGGHPAGHEVPKAAR